MQAGDTDPLERLRADEAQQRALDAGQADADEDVRTGHERAHRGQQSVEGDEVLDREDVVGLEPCGLREGEDVVGREDGHGAVTPEEPVHAVEDHELSVRVVAAAESEIAVRNPPPRRVTTPSKSPASSASTIENRVTRPRGAEEVGTRPVCRTGAIGSRRGTRSVVRACLGTMNEHLPWAVAAALLLALLITVVTGRRRRAAARAAAEQAAEEASEEHQRTIAERDRSHEVALKALTRRHETERDLGRTELETAQEEAEQTRDALARTWRSEAVSHTLIREACASAGLSGVLATNVVFVPVEARTTRRFLAQIDHLLLTRYGALIIEAKYWQGVVFDGVRPGTVHPSYGVLVDEDALPEAFAVQIAPGTASRWTVRTHVEQHVPARQVRIQAARLKEHLALQGLPTPWFETAVLYSHPDVRTYAPGWQGTGAARTRIMTGLDELTDALADLARRPGTTIEEDAWRELSGFLAGCGGHVEPVGPIRA
ncbi:hypothetical protein C5D44_00775 [Rathayibacter sp. AY1B5]|nr:hypothetical protein C5D44_00775 [Rathayibacter sp. AY1B5]